MIGSLLLSALSFACTVVVVGKNVSATGRVIVGHNEDDGMPAWTAHSIVPARDWPAGSVVPAEANMCHKVPQVPHTFATYWAEIKFPGGDGSADAFCNEKGVLVVSDSGGRSRERDDDPGALTEGGVGYLVRRCVGERATSARDAVRVIGELVETYGYHHSARIYTVADRDEAWLVQVVRGRNFCARRCPDDEVTILPNCYSIRRLDLIDAKNLVCSKDLQTNAKRKGFWDGVTPFDFAAAYQGNLIGRSEWFGLNDSNIGRYRQLIVHFTGRDWPKGVAFPFSVKPAKAKVGAADVKSVLSGHVSPHGNGVKHDEMSWAICRSWTVESMVCEFSANPADTVLSVAGGPGCENKYRRFRPFRGEIPADMDRPDPASRLATHVCPCVAVAEPRTFCNPLPLPDIPRSVYEFGRGTPHRQTSDPAMLRENGVWYFYPSAGGIWTSADDGGTWRKDPTNDHWRTYAPAVTKNRGRFLFVPDWTGTVYEGRTPVGPWQKLGAISLPTNVPYAADPSLFSDDDGRLYFYWGCTEKEGIWGCELDAANPTKRLSEPKQLIRFDPVGQPWEKLAVHPEIGWLEGSWMIKVGKKYVLTYSAAGTENPTYAMGAYNSDSPLGTFKPQRKNPFFVTTQGFVTGTAHGSLARDEHGDWWVSYCIIVGDQHRFERRVGMDRIEISEDGEIAVSHATDEPQWLPKYGRGAAGWKKIAVKTLSPDAADGHPQTHIWLDSLPAQVSYEFVKPATVCAFRLCWREGRYDPDKGVNAGPVRYRLHVRHPDGVWQVLCDASKNGRDFQTDYRETEPVKADAARLEVLQGPKDLELGLSEWTLFGEVCGE